jgi:hypothetical protein
MGPTPQVNGTSYITKRKSSFMLLLLADLSKKKKKKSSNLPSSQLLGRQ